MPLPNPDYLTNEYFYWDGRQFPAVLLADNSGSPISTGNKRIIRWDCLDSYDRARVHDLIMGYINRAPAGSPTLTEAIAVTNFPASAAYHTIKYSLNVGGSPSALTGLVSGTNYTFSVILNGTTTSYSIAGADADTFVNLVSAINTAFAAAGSPTTLSASIFGGNIDIASIATGSGQDVEVIDGTLFKSITGFKNLAEKRVGVSTIGDVFDLNYRNEYQTYRELLIGTLRLVPNQTLRPGKETTDVYLNHGTGTWLLVYSDATP